jgi:hypothetical protein
MARDRDRFDATLLDGGHPDDLDGRAAWLDAPV